MKTKVGVGYSNQTDSKSAGKEAALAALKDQGLDSADFALVFCGGKHEPKEFIAGINEILPNTPKAGGTSFGIITRDFIGYDGFEVGVTVFKSETMRFEVFAQGALNENEFKAGNELGKQIKNSLSEDTKALMVFYDSSKQQNPPMLNFATPLFAALQAYLPENLAVAGGGFLADMMLSTCFQIVNDEVYSQHAIGILISGDFQMETAILHGCNPCSDYMTVTKTEGPVLMEIDDQPAIDVINDLLGVGHGIQVKDFAMNVTLGLNRGDKFSDFKESDYANRLTLAVDEETKSLIMFEPDLQNGDEVQLMRRNMEPDYIGQAVKELKEKANGKTPVFSFYINCGGRAKPFAGVNFEDAQEVAKTIGDVPFSGFYSGVEVAKVGDYLQPLDWTGVLCYFVE